MAPELVDNLVVETLLRASLACKRWRRLLADPAFRRRHRALHRTPPVVGFLHIVKGDVPYCSRFVPNNPASGRPAGRDLPGWLVFDCRHGRALFATLAPDAGSEGILDLVVWDPLTDEQRRLPRPSPPANRGVAAVLCAAATGSYDHRGCHGGPSRVAFIFTTWTFATRYVTSARVYSSETGDWSQLTSVQHPHVFVDTSPCPSALVGDALYFRGLNWYAFEYQLGAQRLSVIDQPPPSLHRGFFMFLMSQDNGGLGFTGVEEEPSVCLCLWSRAKAPDRVAQWAQDRAFELETLLPDGAIPAPRLPFGHPRWWPSVDVLGFADSTDVIFVGTRKYGIYMIQLNSGRIRKVFDDCRYVIPYTSFCIPVIDAASIGEGPREGVSSV